MRRWPLLLGWFVAAVVATSVGFAAVALVDGGLQPADAVSDSPLVGDAGSAQPQGVTASPSGSLLAPAPEVSSSAANGGASGPAAPVPGASASTRNGTSGAGGATSGSSGQAPASTEPNSSRPRPGGSVASPAPTRSGSVGVTRSISTSGGSVSARCTSDRVTLTAWSPTQGYRVSSVRPGPASSAQVEFDGSSTSVSIKVECEDDGPRFEVEKESHDGSGDDD